MVEASFLAVFEVGDLRDSILDLLYRRDLVHFASTSKSVGICYSNMYVKQQKTANGTVYGIDRSEQWHTLILYEMDRIVRTMHQIVDLSHMSIERIIARSRSYIAMYARWEALCEEVKMIFALSRIIDSFTVSQPSVVRDA